MPTEAVSEQLMEDGLEHLSVRDDRAASSEGKPTPETSGAPCVGLNEVRVAPWNMLVVGDDNETPWNAVNALSAWSVVRTVAC